MPHEQRNPRIGIEEDEKTFWEGSLNRLQALFENEPPLADQNQSTDNNRNNKHKETKQ